MEMTNFGQEELFEDASARAALIADRWARLVPDCNEEDMQNSAQWGAIRAARRFDSDGHLPWERWRDLHIRWEIKSLLRRMRRNRRLTFWSQTALEAVESRPQMSFDDLIVALPPTHARVVKLVYQDGLNPNAAGKQLGFSESYGCRIHREALAILGREHKREPH